MRIGKQRSLLNFSLIILAIFTYSVGATELKPFSLKEYESAKEINLSEIKGKKYTLINFWATWCVACIKELPELEELKAKNTDVSFIAINAGEDARKIKKFLKKHTFTYQMLLDTDKSYSKSVGVLELPHTIVIDPQGKIVYSNHRPPKVLNFE